MITTEQNEGEDAGRRTSLLGEAEMASSAANTANRAGIRVIQPTKDFFWTQPCRASSFIQPYNNHGKTQSPPPSTCQIPSERESSQPPPHSNAPESSRSALELPPRPRVSRSLPPSHPPRKPQQNQSETKAKPTRNSTSPIPIHFATCPSSTSLTSAPTSKTPPRRVSA